MKNIIYHNRSLSTLVGLFLTIPILNSCNKDFLEKKPISTPSTVNYYQDEGQIDGAVVALYSTFNNLAHDFVTLNEFRSDNFQNYQYIEYSYSHNDFVGWDTDPLWDGLYSLIYRANQVILHIQNMEIENKNKYLAEAMFMRGYAYFWLVRSYGEIPIVLKNLSLDEALDKSRSPILEVYKQIEKDLDFAVNNLAEESPKGKANKYVAEAVLAKVYIMESGYPVNEDKYREAIPLLEDIIRSGKYHLEKNYADIFTLDGENGSEVIWSAVMDPNQKGNQHSEDYMLNPNAGVRVLLTPAFGSGQDPLLGSLWLSFESGDSRRDVSLDSVSIDANGTLQHVINCSKYEYGYEQGIGWTSDYIFIRYANILLLYAESLDKTGHESIIEDKWGIINKIRNRAGLEKLRTNTDFMKSLMKERRHEFVWEGIRWFDLVRTNDFVEKLKYVQRSHAADFWKFLPIPTAEMDKMGDKWQNNEGY